MGGDTEQLMDWLSGRVRPCGRNKREIERFLELPVKLSASPHDMIS